MGHYFFLLVYRHLRHLKGVVHIDHFSRLRKLAEFFGVVRITTYNHWYICGDTALHDDLLDLGSRIFWDNRNAAWQPPRQLLESRHGSALQKFIFIVGHGGINAHTGRKNIYVRFSIVAEKGRYKFTAIGFVEGAHGQEIIGKFGRCCPADHWDKWFCRLSRSTAFITGSIHDEHIVFSGIFYGIINPIWGWVEKYFPKLVLITFAPLSTA